jgi:hypothetical protein
MKLSLLCGFFALAATAFAGVVSFPECPAVGIDTSGCELLITVTAVNGSGAATVFNVAASSPDLGPFDTADDTLIGILNSSSGVLDSITLTSTVDIFGFDGDGACAAAFAPIAGCAGATDPSGYAPVGVTFSGINVPQTSGTVNFSPGIAVAGSNWFSLEEPLTVNSLTGAPEPGSVMLLGGGLAAVLGLARRRRRG